MSVSYKPPEGTGVRMAYQAATVVAAVTAVFCLVTVVLLIANAVQLRISDPLNSPALVALREQFAGDTGNEALKQDIRTLDLLARKAYFTGQAQIRRGGIILLAGAVVLIVLIVLIDDLRMTLPDPSGCPGLDSVWHRILERRRATMVVAIALVLGGTIGALVSSSVLDDWGAEPTAASAEQVAP